MKTRALRYFIEAYSTGDDGLGDVRLAIPKRTFKSVWAAKQALRALVEQWKPNRVEIVAR